MSKPSRKDKKAPPPRAEAPTLPQGGGPENPTLPPGTAPAGDRALYDFLAPPQRPDELGRLGAYRVLKVLGSGGMGVVFLAEDTQLNRPVALKAMLPGLAASASAKERFLREARAAAAIPHDHIVPIYHVGEERGAPYLAMPFLQGESLEDRLQREGELPLGDVLRVGREAALGLAAAHARGLIHRDVKPANLWLEARDAGPTAPRFRVKLLDFGLARGDGDGPRLTRQGAIVGTPAFMAPEQVTGKDADARSDLFSLGCVLYRACTGRLPFQGADMVSTLMAVATEQPPAPKEVKATVPAELSALVMRLLAKDPKGRPASARAVAEALEGIERRLRAARTAKTAAGTIPPQERASPRKPARWGVGGCLLVTGLLLLPLALVVGGVAFFLNLPPALPTERVGPTEAAAVPAATAPAPATHTEPEDGPGVKPLFNGRDLGGWNVFEGEREAFGVEDGLLVAKGRGGVLLTQRQYADFDLRLDYRPVTEKASASVVLRTPQEVRTNYPGLRVSLFEDAGGKVRRPSQYPGALTDVVPPSNWFSAPPGEWHRLRVVARGHHVMVELNDARVVDAGLDAFKDRAADHAGLLRERGHLGIITQGGRTDFRNLTVERLAPGRPGPDEERGWVQVFNGKDLNGWKPHSTSPGTWEVKDGVLVGKSGPSLLFTERDDYDNFHCRIEAQVNDGGNSGLYFRTPFSPGFPKGYEAQINATSTDIHKTGTLFPMFDPKLAPEQKEKLVVRTAPHKAGEWFTQEVIADGNHLVIKVNGKTTVDFVDKTNAFTRGHFALQVLDQKTVVKFRKVELKELPPIQLGGGQGG